MRKVPVVQEILSANDEIARENRRQFDQAGVMVLNIMASPGAGKTSLVLQTVGALHPDLRIGVVEGDVASQVDSERVAETGVPVVQINTGGGCHLDAPMLRAAMKELPLEGLDLLLVENVGNLVCPAAFRIGEHLQVVVASLPEGDDKPLKYPALFIQADAIVINKIDLAPYLDFDGESFRRVVLGLNPDVMIFEVSCRTGEGILSWIAWLRRCWEKIQGP